MSKMGQHLIAMAIIQNTYGYTYFEAIQVYSAALKTQPGMWLVWRWLLKGKP